MLTEAQREQYIRQIEELPKIAGSSIRGLTEKQLDTPYREGGWTLRQVIHHLADSHMNAYIRMKLVLTENHPTLKPYDQEEWAKLTDSNTVPPDSSLAILHGLHYRWAALLKTVSDKQWERAAYHPENGEMSLDDLLELYGNHGLNHVNQIRGLRSQKGW